MGTLTLVRHGQASLFSADYDRLSALGERQARLLGEHWAARDVAFDEAITGPRRRQRDTARIVAEAYADAGKPFPEPRELADFDEMHAEELLRTTLPSLVEQHASLRAMMTELAETAGQEQLRGFQRVFEAVMRMWIDGMIHAPDIESWQAFCARVAAGIGNLRDLDRKGRRVVAFTSGGTIAAAMRAALELSDQKMLDVSGVIRNASITEIAVSRSRMTPTLFNALPHLPDPSLITSR
ncbi:MAG: histidine phosphatase family protein [Deltaproteobacteria bacterium]|nr:histidine phosphatase family protein [Deltaproteobacteria bacterium]